MNTETKLRIRWLLTQKEAAIAEANHQTSRGGWLCDLEKHFAAIDAEIEALINPNKDEPPKEEPPNPEPKPKMMRCENWDKCTIYCPKAISHLQKSCCQEPCGSKYGVNGSKCVEVSP